MKNSEVYYRRTQNRKHGELIINSILKVLEDGSVHCIDTTRMETSHMKTFGGIPMTLERCAKEDWDTAARQLKEFYQICEPSTGKRPNSTHIVKKYTFRKSVPKRILETKIRSSALSVYIQNALLAYDFDTIGELIEVLSSHEGDWEMAVLRMKRFGSHSLEDLKKYLLKKGVLIEVK